MLIQPSSTRGEGSKARITFQKRFQVFLGLWRLIDKRHNYQFNSNQSMTTLPSTLAPLAGIQGLRTSPRAGGPLVHANSGRPGADVVKVERPGAGDDTRHWGPPF